MPKHPPLNRRLHDCDPRPDAHPRVRCFEEPRRALIRSRQHPPEAGNHCWATYDSDSDHESDDAEEILRGFLRHTLDRCYSGVDYSIPPQTLSTDSHSLVLLIAASFLIYDKLFRWARYAWKFRGTSATLHPLPNNGTRILLNKSSKKVSPGKHLWLWIPGVKRTQTHPFTVVNNNQLEIVLAAQNG